MTLEERKKRKEETEAMIVKSPEKIKKVNTSRKKKGKTILVANG
jgi:hypothetical protein